jgi:hypothetical protein
MVPNDPYYSRGTPSFPEGQWYLRKIQMDKAWDLTQGENIIISHMEAGVNYNHEDIKNNILADCNGGCPIGKGYDFVDLGSIDPLYVCADGEDCTISDNDPLECSNSNDCTGHSTLVSSVPIATTNNNLGISGVCPRCKLLPVRYQAYFKYNQEILPVGNILDYFRSIIYAVDNGARIIILTSGFTSSDPDKIRLLKDTVSYVTSRRSVIIYSSDNSNQLENSEPSKIPEVIVIAGTDKNDGRLSSSNYGNLIDLAAPSDKGISTDHSSNTVYQFGLQGNSFAAPLVAGVAGLMLSRNPGLTSYQVESILKGATDFVTTEADKPIGTGRINAYQALLDTQLPCNPACASNQYCSSGTCLPKNNKCVSSNCDCADIIRDGIVDIKDLKKFLDDFRSDCRNIQPIYLLHQINRLNDLETVRNCNIFNNYCAFLDINYDGILKPLDVLTLINSIDSCPDRFSSPNMNTNSDVNDDKYVNYKDKDILVASLFKYPVGSECK